MFMVDKQAGASFSLNLAPVDRADEGERLDPVAVKAELDGVVGTVEVSQCDFCIAVVEQFVVDGGLLEEASHHAFVALLGFRESLLIKSHILIHGVSLLIEHLDTCVEGVCTDLLLQQNIGGQHLGAQISHGIILEHGSLSYLAAQCGVVGDAERSLYDLVEHILCLGGCRSEAAYGHKK